MAGQRGDVMVMPSAAGLPLSQPAMKMSAGLVASRSLVRPLPFSNLTLRWPGTMTEVKDLIPQAIEVHAYYNISPIPAGHSMMTKIKGSIRAELKHSSLVL